MLGTGSDQRASLERRVAYFLVLAVLCGASPQLVYELSYFNKDEIKETFVKCQKKIEDCARAGKINFNGGLWSSETYRSNTGKVVIGPLINPRDFEQLSDELSKNIVSLRRIRNIAINFLKNNYSLASMENSC
ncbi:MAG: hypothetical protein ACP5GO_00510 [Thermoprotei archaeon]